MKAEGALPAGRVSAAAAMLAVWGPGLLVMLADTDVGNIVTAAQSGTQWGYRLLPVPLLLILPLFMIQELAVRLGLFGGRGGLGQGFGALVRMHCGAGWAWLAGVALVVSTLGSIVTELAGIAGVGETYGASRWLLLPLAAGGLLLVVLSGRYRRVERVAVVIGLFELSFLVVAYASHPRMADMMRDLTGPGMATPGVLYLGAALIGATFNPWMIFYQSSALEEKGLGPRHYTAAKFDLAAGATLTQVLTAAVIVVAAATLGPVHAGGSLEGVGQISEALMPVLGEAVGRLVFGAGVVGAAIVAAIVSSLALAWGLAELAGVGRGAGDESVRRRWFALTFTGCVGGGTLLVLLVPDLVWLTVLTQVANALLMPLVVGLLLVVAARHLPVARRLRGWYLWVVAVTAAVLSLAGLLGALAGLA